MALELNPPSAFRPRKEAATAPVLLPPSSFKKQRSSLSSSDQDSNQIQQSRKTDADPAPNSSAQDGDVRGSPSLPHKVKTQAAAACGGPTAADTEKPWQALVTANKTLEELKEQNAELIRIQQRRLPLSLEGRRVDVHQPPPPPSAHHHPVPDQSQYLHLRHTADILTRQATEVAQLKAELDGTRARSAQEVAELREKLRQTENDKITQMSQLRAKLTSVETTYRTQMEDMKRQHETQCSRLESRVTQLDESLQRNESMYKSSLSTLQANLDLEKTQHTHNVTTLKSELRSKEEEVSSLGNLVAQLRTYIGDSRHEVQKNSQWEQQKVMMEKRIKDLEKECSNLQSTVQLINIRLSSANEILTIQESQLAKGNIDNVDDSKLASGLLTRWREKVFALMVQLKSQDIASAKDAKDQQNMLMELENKASTTENKCRLLEHTVADKDAQIEMERSKVQNIEDELQSLQQVADALDAKLQDDEDTVSVLYPFLNCFREWQNSHQERMHSITSKLGAFEQRVNFATSRIDVLKGLFARKDALLKIQMSQHKNTILGVSHIDASTSPEHSDELKHLVVDRRMSYDELLAELERVKQERATLAGKIKDDATFFEETLQSTKGNLETKIAQLEETSARLEETIAEMTQQMEGQCSELEGKTCELTEANDTISKLKVDIAKLQLGADKASKERCEAVEIQYKSQLTEMEQRVNEARREHAKAVVSLRQLERQQAREKERSAEMLSLQDDRAKLEIGRLNSQLREVECDKNLLMQAKLEIGRLNSQLREVERDKNLLMATLRQEGLINQYKAQRAAAKRIPPDKDSETSGTDSAAPQDHLPSTSDTGLQVPKRKADNLSTMIADIRTLTEQVLVDEDEEDQNEG